MEKENLKKLAKLGHWSSLFWELEKAFPKSQWRNRLRTATRCMAAYRDFLEEMDVIRKYHGGDVSVCPICNGAYCLGMSGKPIGESVPCEVVVLSMVALWLPVARDPSIQGLRRILASLLPLDPDLRMQIASRGGAVADLLTQLLADDMLFEWGQLDDDQLAEKERNLREACREALEAMGISGGGAE